MAVKRKYECERRSFKESSKGDSFKSERVKKAKYDRRKQRVSNIKNWSKHFCRHNDRRKSVLTENERKHFDKLNKNYMTDESDCSDSTDITVHEHPWRSQR